MRKLLLILTLLFPAAVFAAGLNVSIVSPEGMSAQASKIAEETASFMGGKGVSVDKHFYGSSADVSQIDAVIFGANDSSDILVLLGEVTAGRAVKATGLKPTVAVFTFVAHADDRFAYSVTADTDYQKEFQVFKKLFGFERIKVLTSGYAYCSSKLCADGMSDILASLDVPYDVVSMKDRSKAALAEKFSRGDSVLILSQPDLSQEEFSEMADNLAELGARTFTFGYYSDAQAGVLAVNSPDKDYTKTARTVAMAVSDAADGKKGSYLIRRSNGLVINMAAALKADFSPKWDYIRTAELLNYEKQVVYDKYISFKDALKQAVETNEDVATGVVDLETAKELLNMSKSALRPTVTLSTGYTQIDEDRARIAAGTAPEKTVDVAMQLQQIIYSEEVLSLKDQALYNKQAKEALARQAELDVVQSAAKSYLNVLLAQTYIKIALDNLATTKSNYILAKNRDAAGAANPAELHRWEARIALAKIDVVNAENMVKSAMTELARIITEDIDGTYELEDLGLQNNYTILNIIQSEKDVMDNQVKFNSFKKRMTEMAVKNSVELKALKSLAEAQQRSVKSAQRKFYHPTVVLGGEYKYYTDKQGSGREAAVDWYDDEEWAVSVRASLPIYEGGKKFAGLNIEKADLRKVYHEKAKVTKLVRQRMITSLENARAAYDSYVLARHSAEAAAKTVDIVADLYSRGAVSVTELIDAQNARLNAELNAASGEYGFMEKLVDVERAYGVFYAFADDTEKEKMKELILNKGNM